MTVYEALPADRTARITAQARQWSVGTAALAVLRAVLSAVGWLLVGLGRVAFHVCAGLWLATTWTVAAVKVGWDDARGPREDSD